MITEQLYRALDLSKTVPIEMREPILYVAVYALSWDKRDQPEVGFLPAEPTIYSKELQEYLDESIELWRNERQLGEALANTYIDAYQAVRKAMLGKILPP
ncbi:hypothetical protein LCGC14_2268020 [marine sediment metagenome]|uniref:Uncharacterized protein n=1 Tax=marine sediment metagenome TaxID=412755 RepID=A0A0F9DK14_9ZZZZ